MSNTPQRVNENHFATEKFPEIIAFCERDDSTHLTTPGEESYEYSLYGKTRYMLKRHAQQWELMQLEDGKVKRVSTGRSLGMVLWQALRYSPSDAAMQESFVNIIFPVAKSDVEKSLAFMYYCGGYPGNFLEKSPEMGIILDTFLQTDMAFLSYSYVPVEYIEWLRELLKEKGIVEEGGNVWVYKK